MLVSACRLGRRLSAVHRPAGRARARRVREPMAPARGRNRPGAAVHCPPIVAGARRCATCRVALDGAAWGCGMSCGVNVEQYPDQVIDLERRTRDRDGDESQLPKVAAVAAAERGEACSGSLAFCRRGITVTNMVSKSQSKV